MPQPFGPAPPPGTPCTIERLDCHRPWPLLSRTALREAEQRLQAAQASPLMDLAGLATARLAMALAPHARRFWVFAGPGNNGGDGLEAATQLHRAGRAVSVCLFASPESWPADARRAWARAQQAGVPWQVGGPGAWNDTGPQDLCIDALLGIGAQRAPAGDLLAAIACLRASPAQVLAVDLPSGLDADSGQPLGQAEQLVRADHTLSLIAAKPGLFMGHGRDVCGTLWLAPLHNAETALAPTPTAHTNPAPPTRPHLHASHKGTQGDVAVIGGKDVAARGLGMRGAAWLAACAALHSGAGRTLVAWPEAPASELPALPDVMLRQLEALELPRLTVLVGCGGGQAIVPHLARLLQHSARLVLDADALNALAADPWLQTLLRARAERGLPSVLTPHPLEAARLLGCRTPEVQADRLGAARALAERHRATVVLKGSGTVLAQAGQPLRINPTGNGRLAIGGTGDVLAGFIAGCWIPERSAWDSACEAVWRHGDLADRWPAHEPLTAGALARRWP